MALTEYRRKRHFDTTPEPDAKVASRTGWSFVVQKHSASHLHYDFRLELDGVLKSWAVPKGPCLDPNVKRLAVEVEDHPVEYGNFEGIIPEGQYGGGTVLLWDAGQWKPVGNPLESYQQGKLKFTLSGEKLKGAWTLVRTRNTDDGKKRQWLLIKERDNEAQPLKEGDILVESPLSVKSGRDLEDIAAARDRVWSSKTKPTQQSSSASRIVKSHVDPTVQRAPKKQQHLKGVKCVLPTRIDVQLATLTDTAPQGDEWLHEIKYDGYRMICRIDGKQITFISRNHQDWTRRVRGLVEHAGRIPAKTAILDGEVVVTKPDGTTDFQALQNAFRDEVDDHMRYYAFDLLYLDGQSLVSLPLEERKAALAKLLDASPKDFPIQYSDHVCGSGDKFHQEACRLNLEGSISKRRDRPYHPGRSQDWLKVKCGHRDEFVIGGFTEPGGSRVGFGALLVGYYDASKQFHYAGKVGTGFDSRELIALHKRLSQLEQSKSPFIDRIEKTGPVRTAHWVKPSLVAQITYGSRTREGILRHSVFAGIREDKAAKDVRFDAPVPLDKVARATEPQRPLTAPAPQAGSNSQRVSKRRSADKIQNNKLDYDTSNQSFAGVRLTHPDKMLYPESSTTKLDVARYFRDTAEWILPHIKHRPLVLVRCPDGCTGQCFYQKHPSRGTPENLRQIPIRESDKTENYIVVDDVDGLIALAQLSALEIHAWGSLEDKLERPDRLVFDMDPSPEVPWKTVVNGALQIRQFLTDLGLTSFVKTTGGKGLHIVVPIERRHDWNEVKSFCKAVADSIVAVAPDQYTANMSKAARPNKIFLDYLRNGRGATAVAPYSLRSHPKATISMPIAWNELTAKIHPDQFTLLNYQERLTEITEDPWKEMTTTRQTLTTPIKILKQLQVLR